MPMQVLKPVERGPSTMERFGQAFSNMGNAVVDNYRKEQVKAQQKKESDVYQQLTGRPLSEDPEQRKIEITQALQGLNQQRLEEQRQKGEQSKFERKENFLNDLFSPKQNSPQASQQNPQENILQNDSQPQFNPLNISDEDIAKATAMDPNLGRILQQEKDVALREKSNAKKTERDIFESERTYHSKYSKEAEEEVNKLRSSIPKKEMALNFARNAVEEGDTSYFSPDKLADATGIDLFRTSKGAQLVTAGKENLLSNMGRVSARAQNIWFEQRLNSMFAKIGQSKEANLTVQEMLEGELAIDKAYQETFDKLSSEDEKNYGFVKKDIQKRVQNQIKPLEKEILARTSHRMKEVEEQEMGLNKLRQKVGKNVVKGTPLTMAMAVLYKKKYGENALDVAEKNGYHVPTPEEFRIYQQRPQEFREEMIE